MTILIFSCNRALQLQTLLNSLFTHLTVAVPYTVHVLYAATDADYVSGYERISISFPMVQFHREATQRRWAWPLPFQYWKNGLRFLRHKSLRRTSDFKAFTEQILAQSPHEGVMFLTDDSLFIRPERIDAARLAMVLANPASTYSLSLRHGLTLRPLPPDIQPAAEQQYAWKFRPGQPDLGHWTWRFSVDGHVYPRQTVLSVLRRLHYANPNSLEGFMNDFVRTVRPDLFSTLLFNEQPALVGFVLNKVQTFNANHSLDMSPAYLNQKLLVGYTLTYCYETPVTDFQPVLTAVELHQSATGHRETLLVA